MFAIYPKQVWHFASVIDILPSLKDGVSRARLMTEIVPNCIEALKVLCIAFHTVAAR